MALFVNQENTRTKLQQRVAAELAEKAKKKALEGDGKLPDGVDDSAYLEGSKKTTSLAWAWVLIAIAAVVIVVWLAVIAL